MRSMQPAQHASCRGRTNRLMRPEITTFPQPPPRQYSPPLEARKVCGEKRRGEGRKGERNTWEGGEESCQKGQTQGELKREKDRQETRPHVAAVGAESGWEGGPSSMGTMRQEE